MIYDVIGTSVASQESVVAAFALDHAVAEGQLEAYPALGVAASLGGDTDTIAAMLGAMLGATHGVEVWRWRPSPRSRPSMRLISNP